MTDRIKQIKIILVVVAVIIAVASLVVSHLLVRDLSRQERNNMEVWAEAMRSLSHADEHTDLNLVLKVMNSNNHIPVVVLDEFDNVIEFRNVEIDAPTATDSTAYLTQLAQRMVRKGNVIEVDVSTPDIEVPLQILVCYDESILLQRLTHYPYVQLGVISLFVVVAIFALLASKKAEQNKVWVGLSKETAHQLGTPISSLMAWMELLESLGVDAETVGEMNKDVQRLSTIASRFSKIGSKPQMEQDELNKVVERSSSYMSSRISSRISLTRNMCNRELSVKLSAPLFEWVMENLIKNAVDAMEGTGAINITTGEERGVAFVEVADTGKGISRKNFKTIFNPGYTTKKRGWGLGLTLAKRIIEQYHSGKIYVRASEPGVGTTFRIDIPLNQ
jgi:signal transduction histidine kinase